MPAANMNRKNNKRELDRSQGNIVWAIQHLQVVYQAFYDTAIEIAETEQDIPEAYTTTMNALQTAIDAGLELADFIGKVNETI